jgi:hypothetical protein
VGLCVFGGSGEVVCKVDEVAGGEEGEVVLVLTLLLLLRSCQSRLPTSSYPTITTHSRRIT